MYNICLFEKLPHRAMRYLERESNIFILHSPYNYDLSEDIKEKIDAIIIRAKGRVSDSVISESKNLKVIGRFGVGTDNIDVIYARKKSINILNTPFANYKSVAEFIAGLLLCLSRRIIEAYDFVRTNADWINNSSLKGFELYGKTAGVIGAGKIGTYLASILANGFQMELILYDYRNKRETQTESKLITVTDDLKMVLSNSDVLIFCLPLNVKTRNLFNKDLLCKIKPSCMVINTSRGEIVDQTFLINQLKDKKISALALDVFREEPFVYTPDLLDCKNFIATPHIAYCTDESLEKMTIIAEKVIDALKSIAYIK